MGLGESVQKGSIQYPDKTAIILGEQSWIYAQFAEIIDILAASLIQLGIKIGDCMDMILSQIRCTWHTVFLTQSTQSIAQRNA